MVRTRKPASKSDFLEALSHTHTEEDVKHVYAKQYIDPSNIQCTTWHKNDLRTPETLFEFKFSKNFKNPVALSTAIAQAMYYVHRTKVGIVSDSIPVYIVVADRNGACIFESKDWVDMYSADQSVFDWKFHSPSNPDPVLVDAVQKSPAFTTIHVHELSQPQEFDMFSAKLASALQSKGIVVDQKLITSDNFENVFDHWKSIVGIHIDRKEHSQYFIRDMLREALYDDYRALLVFHIDKKEEFPVPKADYDAFWAVYTRPPTAEATRIIVTKADRLDHIDKRRFTGEFFTPVAFANLGHDYIAKVLGKDWHNKYYVWDMACGTGNLEYFLPSYNNVFMSELDGDVVEYLNKNSMFPGATIFQYDYLNDDIDLLINGADLLNDRIGWKLPRKLREALADKKNKWVVIVNPPYGEAGTGIGLGASAKSSVADTLIKEKMRKAGLGKAGNELFVQFMFRIQSELPDCLLCMYSMIKYINSQAFEDFRERFLRAEPKGGFIFPSMAFHGTKGAWPVMFSLLDLSKKIPVEEIRVDVYDFEMEDTTMVPVRVGEKMIREVKETDGLNRWFPRPPCTELAFPLKGALEVYPGAVRLDRISKDAIGYFSATANDVAHAGTTFTVSGVYGHGDGVSITPQTVDKIFCVWTIRRLVEDQWTNHNDQFHQPSVDIPDEFITDSAIWVLFTNSNQSSSLRDVEYKGKKWQVRNQFFPFTTKELQGFAHVPQDVYAQFRIAQDTFVAKWLSTRKLSPEARAVLSAAREVYKQFYAEYTRLNRSKFKLSYWDAGWYQIKNSLKDAGIAKAQLEALDRAHKALREKLRPKVYEYGFLDKELIIGEEDDEPGAGTAVLGAVFMLGAPILAWLAGKSGRGPPGQPPAMQ